MAAARAEVEAEAVRLEEAQHAAAAEAQRQAQELASGEAALLEATEAQAQAAQVDAGCHLCSRGCRSTQGDRADPRMHW